MRARAAELVALARICARAGRGVAVATLAVTALGAAIPAGTSLLTRAMVDSVVTGHLAVGAVAGLVALGAAAALLPAVSEHTQNELNRRVNRHCLGELYRAVNGFEGIGRFEDPAHLDRIRMAEAAAGPSVNGMVMAATGLVRSALVVVGLVGVALTINGWLAVIVLGAGVPGLLTEARLSEDRITMMASMAATERRKQSFASVLTNLQAAKEIRIFDAGRYLHGRMLAEVDRVHGAERAIARRAVRLQALMGLLAAALAGGGLVWAASQAAQGALTVGDMSALLVAVAGIQGATQGIVDGLVQTREAARMFGYYAAVTSAASDLPSPRQARPCPPLRWGLELRDVWFRYQPEGPWVLRGLSLTLPQGRTTGLVGLNGAGKSTLIKLLCRFYDPTHGQILWDGVDLRELAVADVRRRLTVVFQDYMEWDLTARENIAVAEIARLADHRRVVAAARATGLDGTLAALPRGYDTLLSRSFAGDGATGPQPGVELSGGQWQRLAISRSLFRTSRELTILDEPSSSLDPRAERLVTEALAAPSRGGTCLLVSHRLSTVRHADRIAVLHDGRIVELGHHRDLVAAGGAYARHFAGQLATEPEPKPEPEPEGMPR